jgi:predicted adenylyl cyclase CyaB
MTNNDGMELEAKVAVEDIEGVEDRLRSLGARAVGRYAETDCFFDFPDERFKHADSALRLRDRKDLVTQKSAYRLTFKGPCKEGPFKHRREIEFSVDQPEQVRALLEAVGLMSVIHYTKTRYSWQWRECAIEVDTLEGIGRFVEVEGPDEARIRDVLSAMELADRPAIRESYLAMVVRQGKA